MGINNTERNHKALERQFDKAKRQAKPSRHLGDSATAVFLVQDEVALLAPGEVTTQQ